MFSSAVQSVDFVCLFHVRLVHLHFSSFKNSYNNELVKCLEDLSTKREAIAKEILSEEEEKNKLQNDLRIFSERLARINESLSKKIAARWE